MHTQLPLSCCSRKVNCTRGTQRAWPCIMQRSHTAKYCNPSMHGVGFIFLLFLFEDSTLHSIGCGFCTTPKKHERRCAGVSFPQ
ncbi:hypothetical protein DUNSADRAFT_4942 [Dunaliella salina]|uniref:Encoded protein n=1 Tax=Dunaliella salina TaxID=3046 RepID=A0ABQ7GR21_DUNSA|nr:hypothetical protein DUNSADRAFT_4942 [Dunaliella salina]|eukprot:KAF5837017.1 hypothetical protein DUNSADRAFT_4942 [Dunaliella salina]